MGVSFLNQVGFSNPLADFVRTLSFLFVFMPETGMILQGAIQAIHGSWAFYQHYLAFGEPCNAFDVIMIPEMRFLIS